LAAAFLAPITGLDQKALLSKFPPLACDFCFYSSACCFYNIGLLGLLPPPPSAAGLILDAS
jgi:hypothetical protein